MNKKRENPYLGLKKNILKRLFRQETMKETDPNPIVEPKISNPLKDKLSEAGGRII